MMHKKRKKILVSCGTGLVECSVISDKIMKILSKNSINAEIIKCKVSEVESCYKSADIIISTTQLPPRIDKPKLSGVPFITGNELDKAVDKLLDFFNPVNF